MSLLTTVQAAAEAVGVERPTAVAGATDDNGRRLYRIAVHAADELLRRKPWAVLLKGRSITGNGTSSYDLPNDYHRGIPASEWDRTQHQRVRGNQSSAVWQTYQSGYVGSTTLTRLFMFRAQSATKRIFFEPALTSSDVVAFDYISDAIFDDGMGAQHSTWSDDSYTCLIDEHLVELNIIWRLKMSIGEDYQEDKRLFMEALSDYSGHDAPAETIYLGREEFALVAVTPETIAVP